MIDSDVRPLPDYTNPPVIEVVIGAQFATPRGFQVPHMGLFWEKIREEYPNIQIAPPLSPTIEPVTLPKIESTTFEFMEMPIPRVFFLDQSNNWLVQLQLDRLLQNWRVAETGTEYPRFPKVLERFQKSWKTLNDFCEEQNLSAPLVNQLEVTYINHIVMGDGWHSPRDFGKVFVDVGWKDQERFLPEPEVLTWKMSFALPDQQGRLHISIKQGARKADNKPVILCDLTARGMPEETSETALLEWITLAREWIVRGFADIMHSHIQSEVWGKKNG